MTWNYKKLSAFLFLSVFVCSLFYGLNSVSAYFNGGSFPNDAKRINLDIHSGTSGTLLATSTSPRTILYSEVSCDSATDNHIRKGTSGNDYLVDTEENRLVDVFNWEQVASNTPIQWLKEISGDHCNYAMIYTDYNLASSTSQIEISNWSTATSTTGSSTTMTITNDIGTIQYIATTTTLTGGQQQTIATYHIPFYLFIFIFILILAIYGIIILAIKLKK